jgi:hypothetical protein
MIDPAALKIANEGYAQFREKQKRYIHSEANRDILIKFLKEKQLALSDWNINAWMLAFGMSEDQLMMELPQPEKPEPNREWININGRYVRNHAYQPERDPHEKSGAQILAETIQKAAENINKLAEVKVSDLDGDSPFRESEKVRAKGIPDAALPDNDPKVRDFLRKMKTDTSPEASGALKRYLQLRSTYKQTHQELSND